MKRYGLLVHAASVLLNAERQMGRIELKWIRNSANGGQWICNSANLKAHGDLNGFVTPS